MLVVMIMINTTPTEIFCSILLVISHPHVAHSKHGMLLFTEMFSQCTAHHLLFYISTNRARDTVLSLNKRKETVTENVGGSLMPLGRIPERQNMWFTCLSILQAVFPIHCVSFFLLELCGFIMIERGDIVEDEKCTVNSETQMHLSP